MNKMNIGDAASIRALARLSCVTGITEEQIDMAKELVAESLHEYPSHYIKMVQSLMELDVVEQLTSLAIAEFNTREGFRWMNK